MIRSVIIKRCLLMQFNKNSKFVKFISLTEHEEFKLKGILAPRFYYLFLAPLLYFAFLALYRMYTKNLIALKWRKLGFRATLAVLGVFILLTSFNLAHSPFMILSGPLYNWLYLLTDISFNVFSLFNLGSLFILILASFNLYWLMGDIYV